MIYIIKFERPIGNPESSRGRAQYYVGCCKDVRIGARLYEHRIGRGASITRAALEQGIRWHSVLLIPGAGYQHERYIKDYKNTPQFWDRYQRGTLRCFPEIGAA